MLRSSFKINCFSSSVWSGGYQCKYVMNLIQAFPVCTFDEEESFSAECEGLGDAPVMTTVFSAILRDRLDIDRSIRPSVVVRNTLGLQLLTCLLINDAKVDSARIVDIEDTVSRPTLHLSNHATNCRRSSALRYFTTVGLHDTIKNMHVVASALPSRYQYFILNDPVSAASTSLGSPDCV